MRTVAATGFGPCPGSDTAAVGDPSSVLSSCRAVPSPALPVLHTVTTVPFAPFQPPGPSALQAGEVARRQAELRAEAGARLVEVLAGAAPRPLTPDLSRAMAQVAFRARHASLDGRPSTSDRLARVFLALLSHDDLDPSDLAWVAQDQVVSDPTVLEAVLSHPACSAEVVVRAGRYALWGLHGALQLEEWTRLSSAVPVLAASGPAGQSVTLLLALWEDDDAAGFAEAASRLLCGPPGATEILATLAADFRSSHQRVVFRIGRPDLQPLLDQALLLAAER